MSDDAAKIAEFIRATKGWPGDRPLRDRDVRLGRLPSGRECLEGNLQALQTGQWVRVVGRQELFLVGPVVWRAGMAAKALIKEISDGERK